MVASRQRAAAGQAPQAGAVVIAVAVLLTDMAAMAGQLLQTSGAGENPGPASEQLNFRQGWQLAPALC
jgi:hypothetical protein